MPILTALVDGMAAFTADTRNDGDHDTVAFSNIERFAKSRGLILMTPLTGVVMESLTLMGVREQISSGLLTLVMRPQV
jgi:hypothetical protein